MFRCIIGSLEPVFGRIIRTQENLFRRIFAALEHVFGHIIRTQGNLFGRIIGPFGWPLL